jgi:hypothetical protein
MYQALGVRFIFRRRAVHLGFRVGVRIFAPVTACKLVLRSSIP